MTRPPVGTVPQQISDSALAAHVASRLVGGLSDRRARDVWLREHVGVKVRSAGLERASERARSAVSPSVLVDESRLGMSLDKAYVHFPGVGRRRPVLTRELTNLGCVRQLLVTRSRRDVICVLVYQRSERDEIFAALESLGEPFAWDEILEEDRAIEQSTWVALAGRIAVSEDLAKG